MEDTGQWTPPDNEPSRTHVRAGSLAASVADLERRTLSLKADIKRAAAAADRMPPLQSRVEQLQQRAAALEPDALAAALTQAQDEAGLLYFRMRPLDAPSTPAPKIEDIRRVLPHDPNATYPLRQNKQVRRIVVHHTATSPGATPEQIAQAEVDAGKPGLRYHFLIAADGKVYWTQPLEVAVAQTGVSAVNEDAIGIALIGNFMLVAPGPNQIAAAATLIAWLLSRFELAADVVVGRRELEDSGSPGAQWDHQARYRDALLARVRAILWSSRGPEAIIGELRQELRDLHARVASDRALAAQVTSLQAQVAELRTAPASIMPLNGDALSGEDESRAAMVVEPPGWRDVVKTLPRHPTLDPYPKRAKPPTMIVIHHTDTPKNFTVEQIARYHVYGERKDTDGNIVKGPWPGIGYHFVIAADGTIYKCQDEMTRSYHVGGAANDVAIGVSLIGRFMKLGYDGKAQKVEDQTPTPEQLRSTGKLAAWLMQQYKIPVDRVMGHQDVWPRSTACPGDSWKTGTTWRTLLVKEIQTAQDPHTTRQIEHYLLFWDHGVQWAQGDWDNAQPYIARFRPTCGFSVDDAMLARRVTIVGSVLGVSGTAEARLKAAGVTVHRLSGRNEAETKALLDALVAKGTPWPGAQKRTPDALEAAIALRDVDQVDELPVPDEWTIPDDWTPQ